MKRLILGLAVILSLGLAACSGGGGDTKAKADSPKTNDTETKKLLSLTDFAKKDAVDYMKTQDLVEDAAVEESGKKLSLALVVGSALNDETVKDYADTFLRTLSSDIDGSKPTKDYYGELYDGRDLVITVTDSTGKTMLQGIKAADDKYVDWQ